MDVISHRGRSHNQQAPDQSFEAYKQAIEAGADAIEVDVQLTKDGHAVLIRYDDLHEKYKDPEKTVLSHHPTTNIRYLESEVEGATFPEKDVHLVNEYTLAELKQLKLMSVGMSQDSPDTEPTNYEILTLNELLDGLAAEGMKPKILLDVDTRPRMGERYENRKDLIPIISEILEQQKENGWEVEDFRIGTTGVDFKKIGDGTPDELVGTAVDAIPFVIEDAQRLIPGIETWVTMKNINNPEIAANVAEQAKVTHVYIPIDEVNRELVEGMEENGVKVIAGDSRESPDKLTPQEQNAAREDIIRAMEFGVAEVMTDSPGIAVEAASNLREQMKTMKVQKGNGVE